MPPQLRILLFAIAISTVLASSHLRSLQSDPPKPILAIELFRHGARAPYDFTWDTNKAWVDRYQELTNTGMREHYLLGQALARDYAHLIGAYDPTKIEVHSTDVNRTIMSAYSQLYGMFPSGDKPLSKGQADLAKPPGLENFNFSDLIKDHYPLPHDISPVPIHTVDKYSDYVLKPDDSCINFGLFVTQSQTTEKFHEFKALMKPTFELIDQLAAKYGVRVIDMWTYQRLFDELISDYMENLPLSINVTYGSKEWEDLSFLSYWIISYYYTGPLKNLQLSSRNLMAHLLEQLKAKANRTLEQSFLMYSAHDDTLLSILAIFDIVTSDCLMENYISNQKNKNHCVYPAFAANIIFELYNETSKPYLKFRYNGNYIDICHNSNNQCDLDKVEALVQKKLQGYTFEQWLSDCGNSQKSSGSSSLQPKHDKVWLFGIGTLCLVQLGILSYIVLKKKNKKNGSLEVENQEGAEASFIANQ